MKKLGQISSGSKLSGHNVLRLLHFYNIGLLQDIPNDDEIVYVGSRRCSARVISQSVQQTLRQIRKNQVIRNKPEAWSSNDHTWRALSDFFAENNGQNCLN
jgi:hypothetical protein